MSHRPRKIQILEAMSYRDPSEFLSLAGKNHVGDARASPLHHCPSPGEEVTVLFPPDAVWVFPEQDDNSSGPAECPRYDGVPDDRTVLRVIAAEVHTGAGRRFVTASILFYGACLDDL